jgi:hypothetical protein
MQLVQVDPALSRPSNKVFLPLCAKSKTGEFTAAIIFYALLCS